MMKLGRIALCFCIQVLLSMGHNSQPHRYQDLIEIFHQTFYAQYQTRLVKGEDEPVYLPADQQHSCHRIIFAHGFYASALHETAHWLVAGRARRKLGDFGYWYHPDGRSAAQQAKFEAVEVKPQAIEWMLSVAAGFDFTVSCDNLDGEAPDRRVFQQRVYHQVARYLSDGHNSRVSQLLTALAEFYQTPVSLKLEHFAFDGMSGQMHQGLNNNMTDGFTVQEWA